MKTPLLVPTAQPFATYLEGISRHARREYRLAMRAPVAFWTEVKPDVNEIQKWMDFWTTQTVEGKHPQWREWTAKKAVGLGTVHAFVCGPNITYGMQLIEMAEPMYAYAWPPLYDKVKHPWVARLMWFKLIEWCCDHMVGYLDLGGGNGKTWRECVARYRNGMDKSYKWLYVPRGIKYDVPLALIPEWRVKVCSCGWRTLGSGTCGRCGR